MKNNFVLSILYRNLVVLVTSCDLSRLYCVGFLLGNSFLLQILSGVCLSFLYMSLQGFNAFYVVLEILDMEAGFLVRSIHITGTSCCFLLLYVHIFKIFFHTLLHSASGLSFILGVIVYFLSVVIAFIGYVLPLSQMSFWGLTVFSNIISAVPSVGPLICFWLWGGEFIQDYTLTKVFSLHVFMPFLLLFVVLFHLLALHSHLSSDTFEDRFAFYYERCLFTGFFLYRDLCLLVLLYVSFAYMAIIYWDFVFHEESFEMTNVVKTPDKIIPEWFFLTFFGFIKCIPSKLGGLGLLVVSILAFFSSSFFLVTPLQFLTQKPYVFTSVFKTFYILSVIGILSTNVVLCFPFIQFLQTLVAFFLYLFLFKLL